MRVLIVSQYFWPENFRINDVAAGLKERGHEVTVLTGIPNYPEGSFFRGYGIFRKEREDYRGVRVVRVPLVPRGKGTPLWLVMNYLSFALTACCLGPFLCRGEFDMILVCQLSPVTVGLPALVFKKLRKAPVVFWVQDLWPESLSATGAVRSPLLLKMVERLVRFIYSSCDLVLVQSEAFFRSVEGMGVPGDRILYLPNSAEEFYCPVPPEQDGEAGRGMPGGFRVMFAGNIGAAQDFDTILAAAALLAEHRDIHWVIIGDGRMRSRVEEIIRERGLGGTVHLLGRHPVESMPRFFSLAHVMLATLRKEPIFALTVPGKIQSYMACGRPVIAALDGEGARIVRESGAGVAVPAESPAALAAAVLSLYSMAEEERRKMGEQGRRYFESHFERNVLLSRLEGWMKELKGKAA